MALRQLRAFYLSSKMGSLSKAADLLNSNQSTISRQIVALEKEMSIPLIHHGARGVQLTPAGEELVKVLEKMFEGVASLGDAANPNRMDTLVTIVSTATLAAYCLPETISEFRKSFKNCRVRISIRGQMDALALIHDGGANLGLLPDPELPSQFEFIHLFDTPMVLIVPRGHPLADKPTSEIQVDDILRYPLILPRNGFTSRSLMNVLSPQGFENEMPLVQFPLSAIEVGNIELATRLVGLGQGVAIVPNYPSPVQKQSGVVLISLRGSFPDQRTGIVIKKGGLVNSAADGYIEAVRRVTSQLTVAIAP